MTTPAAPAPPRPSQPGHTSDARNSDPGAHLAPHLAPHLAIVRAADRDRYISALLAPADRRLDLMTLYAFDAELARIATTVSEPLLGEIRLQWWRDALAPLLTDAGRAATHLERTGHPWPTT